MPRSQMTHSIKKLERVLSSITQFRARTLEYRGLNTPATNLSTVQYTALHPEEQKQTLNSNHTEDVSMRLFTDYGSKCKKVDFFCCCCFFLGFVWFDFTFMQFDAWVA